MADEQEIELELDDDFNLEEDDEEEEEENEPVVSKVRYIQPDSIFNFTKADLAIIVAVGVGCLFLGYHFRPFIEKRKEEHHHHHYYGHNNMPPKEEKPEKPKILDDDNENKREETHMHHPPPNKVKKKRGYYIDEDGNAKLEAVTVNESWIIRRDASGAVVDAYKVPDADFVQ